MSRVVCCTLTREAGSPDAEGCIGGSSATRFLFCTLVTRGNSRPNDDARHAQAQKHSTHRRSPVWRELGRTTGWLPSATSEQRRREHWCRGRGASADAIARQHLVSERYHRPTCADREVGRVAFLPCGATRDESSSPERSRCSTHLAPEARSSTVVGGGVSGSAQGAVTP